LRYAEFGCIQNLPRELSAITDASELLNQFFKKNPVFANSETFDILEDEIGGS